jgi:hypothetical protein
MGRATFNPLVQGSTPWRPTRQNTILIMVLVDRFVDRVGREDGCDERFMASACVSCPQVFQLSGVTSIRPVSSAVMLIAYGLRCFCDGH